MFSLKRLSARLVVATALLLPLSSHAISAEAPQGGSGKGDPVTGTTDWGGLHWGIGIGMTADIQRQNRVVSAANVNGIVRITETNDVVVGFVLEAHYFFTYDPQDAWARSWSSYWGHGPFVAIEAGTSTGAGNGVINAYALGWMIGVRQPTWVTDKNGKLERKYSGNSSWNFGVGLRVDPKAKTLGDGIVANQPLPLGETGTDVRLKTAPRYGVILVSSFSF